MYDGQKINLHCEHDSDETQSMIYELLLPNTRTSLYNTKLAFQA